MEKKTLYKGNWLTVVESTDKKGNKWEYVDRTNGTAAAVIVATKWIKGYKNFIVIGQYRHPLGKYTLEFPAGLIDDGETPEVAALRELLEETGFTGTVTHVSPPVASSSGLTSEMLYIVHVDIEGENQGQRLDDTEKIDYTFFPHTHGGFLKILKLAEKNNFAISSRLYMYIDGERV